MLHFTCMYTYHLLVHNYVLYILHAWYYCTVRGLVYKQVHFGMCWECFDAVYVIKLIKILLKHHTQTHWFSYQVSTHTATCTLYTCIAVGLCITHCSTYMYLYWAIPFLNCTPPPLLMTNLIFEHHPMDIYFFFCL